MRLLISDTSAGWSIVKLGEISSLINGDRGKNYPSKGDFVESGIPFINAGHIRDGQICFEDMNFISPDHFGRLGSGKVFNKDIIYCLRGSLGKAAIVTNIDSGAIASSLVIVRSHSQILSRYIYYFLVSPFGFKQISEFDNGSAQPNLSARSLSNFSLPLAPLNEQKRIADKLDSILARVDACREHLDRIPVILKRFRQAALAAATSGKLTEEWRENCQLPFNWPEVKLADVASSRLGKMLDKSKNQGELTPYLRNINVRWFDFNLDNIQKIRVSLKERDDLNLKIGDVLICEGGEPGRCAVWRESAGNFVYQKALHRVRVSDKLLPEYLCYV